VNGDCCSGTCQAEANGSACSDDGNECTTDQCNAGVCTHGNNTETCDDGDSCTRNDVCNAGSCSGTQFASCGPCLTCDPSGACVAPEASSCEHADAKKSHLFVKAENGKETLNWTWVSSEATQGDPFGDPTTTTDFTLCLYDQSEGKPTLKFSALAPAGDECGKKECWAESVNGFKYHDVYRTPQGLQKMVLEKDGNGKTSIAITGKGSNLLLPSDVLTVPVTVRLERNDSPMCWEATFKSAKKNEDNKFNANSSN
jgi:hypothetical protein